jgi:hypothetical protein
MKTKKNILFLLFLSALILQSCDSMLDVKPRTDLTDNNFWLTEAHFKGASIMLYNQLPNKDHDGRGDDVFHRDTKFGPNTGRWDIPSKSGDWTDPYLRIGNANNIIENALISPAPESVRNRYRAEALFFRAFWYFNLVCKYGDVPLLLKTFKTTNDPDLKMPRTPRETVIQQCYDDLREAIKYLPTRADMASVTDELERRRATRSAALGLMVRIGLNEGTMGKYHNLNNNWQAHLDVCIAAYNDLKAEGHQLYKGDGDHAYLGMLIEERNATNLEIIFGKAHGPNGTIGAEGDNNVANNTNYSVSCQEEWAATRPMIDTYLYEDGLPGNKSKYYLPPAQENSFNSPFGYESNGTTPNGHPRDPRLALTFWRLGDPDDNSSVTVAGLKIAWRERRGEAFNYYYNTSRHAPGYHQKKGHIGDYARAGTNADGCDNIIIRWGEMLISYAEALYERNGSITDAQLDETVNALRARAGFAAKLTNAFATANGLNMLDEIRRERTVELMLEGRRYNDIIRWKIAETVLPKAVIGAKITVSEIGADSDVKGASLTDAAGKYNNIVEYTRADSNNDTSANMFVWETSSVRSFKPNRDYYYPIPTNEIVKSGGNVVQNPNWSE